MFQSLTLLLLLSVCGGQTRISFVGNSLTSGQWLAKEERLPERLGSILGNHFDVLNCGYSGSTALERGVYIYYRSWPHSVAKNHDPQIVVSMLGANDVTLWQYKDEFIADYFKILNSFPGAEKIYVVRPPPNLNPILQANLEEMRPMLKEITASTNRFKYIETHNINFRDSDYTDDVHLSPSGLNKIAHRLANLIDPPFLSIEDEDPRYNEYHRDRMVGSGCSWFKNPVRSE